MEIQKRKRIADGASYQKRGGMIVKGTGGIFCRHSNASSEKKKEVGIALKVDKWMYVSGPEVERTSCLVAAICL